MSDKSEPLDAILEETRKSLVDDSWIDEISALDEDGKPDDFARRVVPLESALEAVDRIERAAKREYEEAKDYFAKLHDGPSMVCTAKNCALRNAAEDIVEQVKAEASLGHFAPVVVEDRAPGNAAATREALVAFVDSIQRLCDGDDRGIFKRQFAPLLSEARAALAAPARNCDRYATAKDALDAFIREKEIKSADVDNMNLRDFFVWLFAKAEGKDNSNG